MMFTPLPVQMPPLDLAVFIGRFQPLHSGHIPAFQQGLERAPFLLAIVGSAFASRSRHNPFTWEERAALLVETLGADDRLSVQPLADSSGHVPDWVRGVRALVTNEWGRRRVAQSALPEQPRVGLLGYAKDASSYYLSLFPEWTFLSVPPRRFLSATDIREQIWGRPDQSLFEAKISARRFLESEDAQADLPPATRRFLLEFLGTPDYATLTRAAGRATIPPSAPVRPAHP